MLATLVDKPFDSPDWIFEIKWDGYRAIAEIEKDQIKLYSRNGLSFNEKFEPIVKDLKKLGFEAVLDGEVVVFDENDKGSFQHIQNYQRLKEGKLVYFVFDLLYLEGYDLRSFTLLERKELLKKAISKSPHIQYCPHIENKGNDFFKKASKEGYEGIIAKQKESPYREGRSREWLKIKTHLRQEFIICGFTEPRGSRKYFGALILGVYERGKLIYAGHTGSGFDQTGLKEIYEKLKPLAQKKCPFEKTPKTNLPATWVEPKIICEVKFAEWTQEGQLRQAIFQGIRVDKKPSEVKRENAMTIKKPEELKKSSKKVSKQSSLESELVLTNLDKVFWPEEGYTKGDLLEYYKNVAPLILPYLTDRPESMKRYPNGINGPHFFQKEAGEHIPSWLKTVTVPHEGKDVHYIVINDEKSLLYTINLGCIDLNPFNSRYQYLDYPDYLLIDLDPEDIDFEQVIEVAKEVHKLLEEWEIPSVCKTSGSRGIHIYVPTGAKYTDEETTQFAKWIAYTVHERIPEITSVERSPSKRQKKVYLDFLQNRFGATLAAPYSVRPKPHATVATPLKWSEVKKGLHPSQFTIKTVLKRFEKVGDLFTPILGKGIDMKKILKKHMNK
jgi:bifunctional non-homologous end joining protein LigD